MRTKQVCRLLVLTTRWTWLGIVTYLQNHCRIKEKGENGEIPHRNFTEFPQQDCHYLHCSLVPLCITHQSLYITQWFFFPLLNFKFFSYIFFFTISSFLKPCSLGNDLFDHAAALNSLSDLKMLLKILFQLVFNLLNCRKYCGSHIHLISPFHLFD